MDFIYRQIELENAPLQEVAVDLIDKIHDQLHGYTDNGPVRIGLHGGIDSGFGAVLEMLQRHKIVPYDYQHNEYDGSESYNIAVINRYKFELLSAELIWLARPEQEKGPGDNTAPYEDDLIYYDRDTGDILSNGTFKTLTGRNKKLFDALFIAAPEFAERKKLLKIALTGKYADEPPESVVSEAFTNLRKICGIKAHALELSRHEGGRLNALVYPLSAQLPSRWLHFKNYRSKSRKELFSPLA